MFGVERFLKYFRKFQNKSPSSLLIMAAKTSRRVVEDDLTNVEFETSEDVEVIPTFDSMGLREDLLRYFLNFYKSTHHMYCFI